MHPIDLDLLNSACAPGGGSCLVSTTPLRPAGGSHAAVAPARFAAGKTSVYAYETRYLDGEARRAVLIDSKQSQLNRVEAALAMAIDDGHAVLSRVPRIELRYGDSPPLSDLTLPHRAYDGHIRAGTIGDVAVPAHEGYRALRDATPANARALLEASPATLVFGGWDASRKARQGRWRSALVGEIVGFCADRSAAEPDKRGGARVDPVGMQIDLPPDKLVELAQRQRKELSGKLIAEIEKKAKAAKKKGEGLSASMLGLGGIPPSLGDLAGVACDKIIRTHVLSFATLRQMRFGGSPEADIACRALLAALALNGLARADAELYLRANCDLIEDGPTAVSIDARGGETVALAPLDIESADALLTAALESAEAAAEVRWQGVALEVEGDPTIVAGAEADAAGDAA